MSRGIARLVFLIDLRLDARVIRRALASEVFLSSAGEVLRIRLNILQQFVRQRQVLSSEPGANHRGERIHVQFCLGPGARHFFVGSLLLNAQHHLEIGLGFISLRLGRRRQELHEIN